MSLLNDDEARLLIETGRSKQLKDNKRFLEGNARDLVAEGRLSQAKAKVWLEEKLRASELSIVEGARADQSIGITASTPLTLRYQKRAENIEKYFPPEQ